MTTKLKCSKKQLASQTLSTGVPYVSFHVVLSYVPPPLKNLQNSQINNKRHKCVMTVIEKDAIQRLKTSNKKC